MLSLCSPVCILFPWVPPARFFHHFPLCFILFWNCLSFSYFTQKMTHFVCLGRKHRCSKRMNHCARGKTCHCSKLVSIKNHFIFLKIQTPNKCFCAAYPFCFLSFSLSLSPACFGNSTAPLKCLLLTWPKHPASGKRSFHPPASFPKMLQASAYKSDALVQQKCKCCWW